MSEFVEIEGPTGKVTATVVFFHGLGGNSRSTWQSSKDDDSFWPKWLVQDLPGVRAVTVDYHSNFSNWFSRSMPLPDRAVNLAAQMVIDQEMLSHPVVLIGHSLGGQVIKQIIRHVESKSKNDPQYKRLLDNIGLVVFLGTPHNGSRIAELGNFFRSFTRPSPLSKSLVLDDAGSRDLNSWYREYASGHIKHLAFSETQPTRFLGMIVSQSSSDPGLMNTTPIPVDADHAKICKPANRSSEVYRGVKAGLEELLKPPPTISQAHPANTTLLDCTPTSRRKSVKTRIKMHGDMLTEGAEKKPFVVLLCGPSGNGEQMSSSARLCESIRQRLASDGFEVILGEDAGVDDPRIKMDENSISNELAFVKAKCNAVVLIADTIGTWCELGLLSWHLANDKEFRKKGTDFIVLINSTYSDGNIFFRRGSFAFADHFGKAEFADLSSYEPATILERLRGRRSIYSLDRRGRPKGAST